MTERIQELERYVCTLYDTKEQLKRHIFDRADRAFEAGDAARDSIDSREGLAERQRAMKQAFLAAIGGLPASDTPLNAVITSAVQGDGYAVENIVFESRPKHYVAANLYLPAERAEPGPAVLFLSGHESEAKHSLYYHEVCLRMVQAGLIVFAIDPVGQGERLSLLTAEGGQQIWGTAEHQRLGVQSYALGESVARYFIHDAMRAIDYLETRPEIDRSRIGVTGNSGGGTQTAMMMVCDGRIAAAAPATFIMNRQQYMHAGGVQDAEQIWPGLSGLGFDHEDLLLAFAPKPLLVCAVQYDFFPIEATRRTVQRSRRFWEMEGRGELLRMVEDRSTHRYTDTLAILAADFFAQHLAGMSEVKRESWKAQASRLRLTTLVPAQLHCTKSGQVQLEYADARTLVDEFKIAAEQLEQAREEPAAEWLSQRVFNGRERCELNPRFVELGSHDGLDVAYALWWSQQGVMNSGYICRPVERMNGTASIDKAMPISIAIWPDGTAALSAHWSWVQSTCASGRAALVLNVSGVGPHEPHPLYGKPPGNFFGITHKLADELIWLGDSLAALRVFDVIRAVDFASSLLGEAPQEIALYAAGRFRIYAELAAILEPRIRMIEIPAATAADTDAVNGAAAATDTASSRLTMSEWLADGLSDDRDVMSIILPGLLRYYDLPI